MDMPDQTLDTVEPFDDELLGLVLDGADDEWRGSTEDWEAYAAVVEDGWTPPTLEQADWAGRRWGTIDDERGDVSRLAAEQIDRIRAWERAEQVRLERRADFFAGSLTRYALRRRAVDGLATTKLPSVTVSTRKVPAGVDVIDEAAAIEWAEDELSDETCAEVVKVEKSFLKSKLPADLLSNPTLVADSTDPEAEPVAAFVTPGGTRIPGIVPRPAGVSASIKANRL